MRAVFVNHCHPDTRHVCAVRAREFAREMARRGHRIVLLTETLRPDDPAETPDDLAARLEAHDWAEPFRLACAPLGHPLLRRQRAGGLPAVLSKIAVALSYAIRGSVFPDWGDGVARHVPVLARVFRPDMVWANFGNTEGLRIARRIAMAAACPWVADIKDYWSTFIPRPFRHRLGRLVADAAALTALSRGHVEDVAPFFPRALTERATVVYSGVPNGFAVAGPASPDSARVLIVGAIYDTASLDMLIAGIDAAGRKTGLRRTVEYAGDQGALVRARVEGKAGIAAFRDHGYMALDRLHALQRTAGANAFIRSGPGWFQHKVPELVAAGRPILCIPTADDETGGLARNAGLPFHGCSTADEVETALSTEEPIHTPGPDTLRELTWERRADLLERTLVDACR